MKRNSATTTAISSCSGSTTAWRTSISTNWIVARNYLNQALAICNSQGANPFQIKHQLGILYLMQACRTVPATLGSERAEAGIKLLTEMIYERGDIDSYPYTGYMNHVTRWYLHATGLISNAQWDDLKRLGQQAAKKYPLDDVVLESRDRVEHAYLLRLIPNSVPADQELRHEG